ncbi:MAG: SPOR domain-containing protein [Sphingomonadaceae bacterium]|nr:SPOR domain-containing protein [Sphingomonadaceae bacterium]
MQRAARKKTADAAAAAAAEQAAKAAKAAELAAARANPARLWVQIATGNNESGLPLTWRRIHDANAEALKGRSAWSAPYKATNRLLVGPVKSPADARALVSALAKGGVKATTFGSDAGQEVARVGGK